MVADSTVELTVYIASKSFLQALIMQLSGIFMQPLHEIVLVRFPNIEGFEGFANQDHCYMDVPCE